MFNHSHVISTVYTQIFVLTIITSLLSCISYHIVLLVQAYSRLAAVLSSLHLTGAAVTALEQLTEIVRKQGQGGRDPFKTASRLDETRRDLRRKQPVHHYRLLGLTQACTDAEVSRSNSLT